MSEDNNEVREKIVESLQISVVDVMNTMAMTEVIFAGKESSDTFKFDKEAGGLVRLTGAHEGMLGVSCNLSLLRVIISSITGLPEEELQQEDLLDGAAELANMVGGGMKSMAQIPGVVLSPPMSIIGSSYMAEWKTDRSTEILTFQMEQGILQVYTSL
jgi:CheY-specific phosphatase CheX